MASPWACRVLLAIVGLAVVVGGGAAVSGQPSGARSRGPARKADISGLSAVNALGADRAGRPFDTSNASLNVFANPSTAGVTFRSSWAAIEPADGTFDFSKIDAVFAQAEAHGKWVDLIFIPGFVTPSWALQGVQTVMCAIAYGPEGGTGKAQPLPVPWDRTYLTRWFAFLRVVGQRYADRASFRKIAAAGPTSVSAEMSLPNSSADIVEWKRVNASRATETFGYRGVLDHIWRVLTGFMMSTSALERSERMGAAGDPPLALRKSINLGMAPNSTGQHVDYLEIYEPDVMAPEMQSVLRYGASLFRSHGGSS